MEIAIAEFEETYLPAMEEEFKQDTMDSIMEQHDSICKQLRKEMETTAKFAMKFNSRFPYLWEKYRFLYCKPLCIWVNHR